MSTALSLTRPQKAAAMLVAMGKPSASRLLKFFKQEELRALIDAAKMLRTIPQSELERIVAEFEAEFTEGAGLLDSADKMETMLNESLSPRRDERADGRREGRRSAADAPPPIWPTVEKLEPARLGAFLAGEHPQTAALVLSKLAPQAAANVLLTLEKSARGEIIKRMLTMSKIPETAVKIVEDQIRARLLVESASKDVSAGQNRVASVLNELDKSQLDEVMQDLEASGAGDLDGDPRAAVRVRGHPAAHAEGARHAVRRHHQRAGHARRCATPSRRWWKSVLSSIGARSRRMIESELAAAAGNVSADDIVARAQVDRLDGDQAGRRGRLRAAVHADAGRRLTFLDGSRTGDAWPNPPTRTARPKKRPRRRSATPSRKASCRTRRKRRSWPRSWRS